MHEYKPLKTFNGKDYVPFNCHCGSNKFRLEVAFHDPFEPQFGPLEEYHQCKCGEKYIREYGQVRKDEWTDEWKKKYISGYYDSVEKAAEVFHKSLKSY